MASRTQADSYDVTVKKVQVQVDRISGDPEKFQLDSQMFQKYLFDTINYLSGIKMKEDAQEVTEELKKNCTLLFKVIILLHKYRHEFEPKYLNYSNILTYLNHLSYNLIKIGVSVPLDWHEFLGAAALEFLTLYTYATPPPKPEFVSDIAQKSFSFLCNAGQKYEKTFKNPSPREAARYYSLYLLGSAILAVDGTDKTRDGLTTAKGFMGNFSWVMDSWSSKQGLPGYQTLSLLVDWAVRAYNAHHRSASDHSTLGFYVELFKLAQREPKLREKLLEYGYSLHNFKIENTHGFGAAQWVKTDVISEVEASEIIMALLELIHIMGLSTDEHKKGSNTVEGVKDGVLLVDEMETWTKEQWNTMVENFQNYYHTTKGPLCPAVADTLVMFVKALQEAKHLKAGCMTMCIQLTCLSMEVFVRDILPNMSKDNVSAVTVKMNAFILANRLRLETVHNLLNSREIDLDAIKELAGWQKIAFNNLCVLTQAVNTKPSWGKCSKPLSQVTKCVEKAMTTLAAVGRNLRRQEMHDEAIALLTPVWPVPNMKEVLPHVSHQETLAECFRQKSQPKRACQIIVEAANIDANLITLPLAKTLYKIVKEEKSISPLKLFDSMKNRDIEKHAQVLISMSKVILTSYCSQHVMGHARDILQALSKHKGLPTSQQAVYKMMLAEHQCLPSAEETGKAVSMVGFILAQGLLKEAISVFQADLSHEYDDYLALSTLMFWEMKNKVSCLDNSPSTDEETSSSLDSSEATSSSGTGNESSSCTDSPTSTDLEDMPRVDMTSKTSSVIKQDWRNGEAKKSIDESLPDEAGKVDGELLMKKAGQCLALWVAWYRLCGEEVIEYEKQQARIEKSLIFLQRVALMAEVNHCATIRIQALCWARNLTTALKVSQDAKTVMANLVTSMDDVGLSYGSLEDGDVDDPDDTFLDGCDIGKDGHVLNLLSVASHHMRMGQLEKFVVVRDLVSRRICEIRQNGPLTPTNTIALAILRRLNAQFVALPKTAGNGNEEDFEDEREGMNPVSESYLSFKYISSAASYYWGDVDSSAGSSQMDSWKVAHEYLTSVKLVGDLFIHTGNVKYAMTYYKEGWKVAKSCLLVTWCAIFACKLAETSLHFYATTKEAVMHFKRAMSIVAKKSVNVPIPPSKQNSAGCQKQQKKSGKDNTVSCSLHQNQVKETSLCACKPKGFLDIKTARSELFSKESEISTMSSVLDVEEKILNDPTDTGIQVVCHAGFCVQCFQPEVAQVLTQLMWCQAEIISKTTGEHKDIVSCLDAAGCTANRLVETSYESYVRELLTDTSVCIPARPHRVNFNRIFALETKTRVAEYSYRALYLGKNEGSSLHSNCTSIDSLENLLSLVITEGKTMSGLARSNVIISLAEMLRVNLQYFSVLQLIEEQGKVKEEESFYDDETALISLAKQELLKQQRWNEQRKLLIGLIKNRGKHAPSLLGTLAAMQYQKACDRNTDQAAKSEAVDKSSIGAVKKSRTNTGKRVKVSVVRDTPATSRKTKRKTNTKSTINILDESEAESTTATEGRDESVYDIDNIVEGSPCVKKSTSKSKILRVRPANTAKRDAKSKVEKESDSHDNKADDEADEQDALANQLSQLCVSNNVKSEVKKRQPAVRKSRTSNRKINQDETTDSGTDDCKGKTKGRKPRGRQKKKKAEEEEEEEEMNLSVEKALGSNLGDDDGDVGKSCLETGEGTTLHRPTRARRGVKKDETAEELKENTPPVRQRGKRKTVFVAESPEKKREDDLLETSGEENLNHSIEILDHSPLLSVLEDSDEDRECTEKDLEHCLGKNSPLVSSRSPSSHPEPFRDRLQDLGASTVNSLSSPNPEIADLHLEHLLPPIEISRGKPKRKAAPKPSEKPTATTRRGRNTSLPAVADPESKGGKEESPQVGNQQGAKAEKITIDKSLVDPEADKSELNVESKETREEKTTQDTVGATGRAVEKIDKSVQCDNCSQTSEESAAPGPEAQQTPGVATWKSRLSLKKNRIKASVTLKPNGTPVTIAATTNTKIEFDKNSKFKYDPCCRTLTFLIDGTGTSGTSTETSCMETESSTGSSSSKDKTSSVGRRSNSFKDKTAEELEDIDNDKLVIEPEEPSATEMRNLQVENDSQDLGDTDQSLFDDEMGSANEESDPSSNLESMSAKFPTLGVFKHVTPSRSKQLKETLQGIQHFPSSFLYSQISRSLALAMWEERIMEGIERQTDFYESNQREIAAHLTDSMNVTFQHSFSRNLVHKLRKCNDTPSYKKQRNMPDENISPEAEEYMADWSNLRGENKEVEKNAMNAALSDLKFGGDVLQTFNERLSVIPEDWVIVQMTMVDYDPLTPGKHQLFITRMTCNQEPVTVAIPADKVKHLPRAKIVYDEAIKHGWSENMCAIRYWTSRYKNDNCMKHLVIFLQENILSGHKWLLRGREKAVSEICVKELLDRTGHWTVEFVYKKHHHFIDFATVRVFLEVLLHANEKDILAVLESEWPPDISKTVAQICMELQASILTGGEVKRGPVVLILDKTLNNYPWESMPDLKEDSVTRVPSLAGLKALLTLHTKRPYSLYQHGIQRDSAVAVLDPENNLNNVLKCLVPQFKQYAGWTCVQQVAPTVKQIKSFLANNALYVYCGHGWGKNFVGGDDLQMFRSKAVSLIMGCHSGSLDYRDRVDSDGPPLYFLMAGCPAVVGNLWLVTDKDIDQLTGELISDWMESKEPTCLSKLVTRSRKCCKLRMNGFAPVVYGLPVTMNT